MCALFAYVVVLLPMAIFHYEAFDEVVTQTSDEISRQVPTVLSHAIHTTHVPSP